MRNDTQTRYARGLPSMATAVADITLAACQRAFALNAAMMEQLLAQGVDRSQDAMTDSPGTSNPWTSPLPQSAQVEQMLRYGAAMMAIGQTTSAAMANLITAQLRGADQEVEMISRAAHDDAAEAASSAAAAAGSVMSTGISAVSRLTDLAAQTGATVGEQIHGQMQAATGAAEEENLRHAANARNRANHRGSARQR
jgi:hypothetical protein